MVGELSNDTRVVMGGYIQRCEKYMNIQSAAISNIDYLNQLLPG